MKKKNQLKEKRFNDLETNNMAFELQKAKKDLINSVLNFVESHKQLKNLEEPSLEEVFEEGDNWTKLFYNMMRYFEIKSAMSNRSDIEIMMEAVKKKLELEND